MCKYCGATQIEEVNGRVICAYCKSPQLDIKPISNFNDNLIYKYMFSSGCIELNTVQPLTITPSIINP